ncbi:MAG: hypothetical protein ACRC8S_05350 [Fimbriiglobus sp.]
MSQPEPDSPFAEFAEPPPQRLGAAEAHKARMHYHSQARRAYWWFLAVVAIDSVFGAATAATALGGLEVMPFAVVFAILGAILGELATFLSGLRALVFFEYEWDAMTLIFKIFMSLGTMIGAGCGAAFAVTEVPYNQAFFLTATGAITGVMLALGVRYVLAKWKPTS